MTAKNRAGLITKLQTSLKKHYKPAPAAPGRPLMEHVLYAALLEDAPVDIADEGFAKCEQEFFDWNEVRVTSVTELAEVLSHFPSPSSTALRLKRCLQSVFESFYSFEIEHLKKENLGKAVAKFEAMNGVSPFVLSYLIQHGLGGHAIPVNSSGMWIMFKTGIVNEVEAKTGKVPGLERAIPKSKAIEFSSMLHQAAVALAADSTSKHVWEIIWSVNKDAEMSAPQTDSARKSAKRAAAAAAAAETSQDEKPEAKSTGKSKSATAKAASGDGEPTPKASKQTSSKPASKSKAAAESPKSTDDSAKGVKPEAEPASKESTAKVKPKAKPATTEKAKPADSKKAAEPKKTTESKKASDSADPEPKTSETKPTPSPKPAANAKAASSASTKSGKGAAPVSKDSAKEVTAKSTKKPASSKTPPGAADVPSDEDSDANPVKESSKKADPKPAKETAVGAGNQKLTKRKPR